MTMNQTSMRATKTSMSMTWKQLKANCLGTAKAVFFAPRKLPLVRVSGRVYNGIIKKGKTNGFTKIAKCKDLRDLRQPY